MSQKDKEKGSKRNSVLDKDLTVECFIELDPLSEKNGEMHHSQSNEVYQPDNGDAKHEAYQPDRGDIKRIEPDAKQEQIENRRTSEKSEEMMRKTKISCVFVLATIVLVVLWVGYLTTAVFLLYALADKPKISEATAFNQTYLANENLDCLDTGEAYEKYNVYITALRASNYTFSPFNVTECAVDFVSNATQCSPECLEFTPGGRPMWWAFRVTTIFGSSFSLIATLLGMLSWIDKELWKFPKVVNFYMMITVLLQALAILSGAIVPKGYYCSNANLDVSRKYSTVPCIIQGAVMHYALLAFLLWYVFALSNLSIIVLSPLKGARWFFKYLNAIHITELIIGWGLPFVVIIINVVVAVISDRIQAVYRIENVPEFCLPGILIIQVASLHFLGFVFCLFNGTMIVIIVVVMVKLKYKQQNLTRSTIVNTEWVFQLSIFTLVFSLSIWIVLLDASIYEYFDDKYTKHLDAYTYCISLFPSGCCQITYRTFYQAWLSTLSGFSTCVWGIGGLTAVTNKEVRQFWKRIFTCKFRK